MLARVASTCSVTEMEELKKETKNSTTKVNLFEDENRRMEEENMALKKLNTAIKEEYKCLAIRQSMTLTSQNHVTWK